MNTYMEILLALGGTIVDPYIPVCDRNFNHLKDSTKIELYIGCSWIRNRRAYKESVLSDIYESDRAIFLSEIVAREEYYNEK